MKLDRDETVSEVDVQDDFDKTKTVKKKIRKADFAYSLNPVLTNLTSAEFKGTDANAPTTKLTNAGVTITPATSTGKKPVSLTENGLDNGGNPITNVAGNLDGAKANTTAPTTKADKPANADTIKNNAATVGDVLNAGWNLQEKGTAKDFVTAYDTVNFVDGDGTTVSVENTDGKTSKIKYSANLGDGLEKDATTNKIKVKAADNTLTTDANGLKVNTGNITASSVPTVADADKDKIATVGNVAEAIKAAAWKATSDKTANGENSGKKDQEVKAGDTVTFEADKNIKIAQADGKFTFSTKDNVEFTTVKVGDTANGKKPVELKNGDVINANNNPEQPTTALNVSSDGKPTQITGVGSVLNTTPVTTTPDGSAPTTQPNVVNLGTAHGQTPLSPNVLNSAATVRDLANMGWKVSSDKTTGADGKDYSDVVRNADEVKFVGKNAAKVSGKTVNGVRTITVDVAVPETKTAELVSSKDGSVIAPSTNPELQKALKDAKDALAALPKEATPEQKEAAENKVKDAETALNKALDNKGVATAKNVADMINASGFTLKTSATADGKKESGDDEVINPGKAVEMIAGKNLTVKQEANGKVTYSTKDNVEFTSVKVGEDKDGKKPVNFTTEKATDASNNDPANKPTTALNVSSDGKPTQITGVGSTLNVKPVDTNTNGTPTADADKPNLVDLVGTKDAPVNKNAAATVGDLQNMGWVVSSDKTTDATGEYKDVVKNANEVRFVGKNAAKVSGKTVNGVRTITVDVEAPSVETAKITQNTNGSVAGPVAADEAKELVDNLKKAEQAVKDLPADATPEAKKAAQDALKAAQDAAAPLNKVATAQNVAEAINNSGWRTNSTTATGGAKDTLINPGKAVNFESGKNMEVAQTVDKDGNVAYTYATKDDVQFNSVQLGGDTGPKLTNDGNDLKVSGSNGTDPVKITNVANGNISADSKDAVNGSQLHATNQSINRLGDTVNNIGGNVTRLSDKVNNMDRDYRAGIAGSNAAASLPQVYLPGKSMVAAAAGTFKGQNALAVGYSSISDNGKLIWKAQANLNSRADVGVGVGMGYLW